MSFFTGHLLFAKKMVIMRKTIFFLLLCAFYGCKDKCKEISCYNGGTCDDGSCICADHYTGEHCETQVAPERILVQKLTVVKWPTFNNGETWDYNGGPDVRFRIENQGIVTYDHEGVKENLANGSSCVFECTAEIVSPMAKHTLLLMDDDGGEGMEIIAVIEFEPYSENNKFPETITATSADAEVRMEVVYVF